MSYFKHWNLLFSEDQQIIILYPTGVCPVFTVLYRGEVSVTLDDMLEQHMGSVVCLDKHRCSCNYNEKDS